LGAVLLQNKPIAFASKSLTDTEQRYANIEREMLGVVFACQKFHTYIFGKHCIIETDQKPLEMICLKNINSAPPRLQRMLLKIQPYSVTVKYRPGKEMIIPDALSRHSSHNKEEIKLDVRIAHIQFTRDLLNDLRESTNLDSVLNALKEIVHIGWPESAKQVPNLVKPYWAFRDEITVEDGLLLKGDRIIIPITQQERILKKLHIPHIGIKKTQQLARNHVY
jgi:hypothetical protein